MHADLSVANLLWSRYKLNLSFYVLRSCTRSAAAAVWYSKYWLRIIVSGHRFMQLVAFGKPYVAIDSKIIG